MDSLPEHKRRSGRRYGGRVIRLMLALAVVMGALCLAYHHRVSRSDEADVLDALGRYVLANSTEGRQALVGSVWWPPIPTVMVTMAHAVAGSAGRFGAAVLVGALMAGCLAWTMNRLVRRWVPGGLAAWLPVVALLVYRPFWEAAGGGGVATLTGAWLSLMAVWSAVRWSEHQSLRALVYLGLAGMGLVGTHPVLALWFLLILLWVGVDLRLRGTGHDQRQAVGLLLVLPVVYLAALWGLLNWLIMGDGWYALRAVWPAAVAGSLTVAGWTHVPGLTGGVCLGLVAVRHRIRSGLWLSFLVMATLGLHAILIARGMAWAGQAMTLSAAVLGLLALAYLCREDVGMPGWLKVGTGLVAVVSALASHVGTVDPAPSATVARRELVEQVARHVRGTHPCIKVFVAGYRGLPVVEAGDPGLFVPSLDFNLRAAGRAYPGHWLYLLAPPPNGRTGTESLYWKYPDLIRHGASGMVFDSEWEGWRLYRLSAVQAPEIMKP
ncbi:MAG: hypothetical protein A2498_12135 [Lentisphaerae bacterium RIFOXYC12_FULL_60_16]|nr:MAG: hypothetical protein A2498_12135 [Lentisphaerae bacterium RIFOXYC12_FULL_60_16]OGV77342.1 MAG: hypothetical protein A2340_06480 [Lentisphaerae bacterium RIFOXYB12_FULL_60_10]